MVGKRDVLELVLLALLADGHVLLEDVPGVAKTLIARSFAAATGLRFGRVQFTPDLLPSDITGSSVFDQRTASFEFRPGPVFCNLLLGDEINRAPPKTQAALLEAMEERQVTADDGTHRARAGPSWCSPRRTRSSTRAPTRCPRPSSTASCCACASATRRPTTSGSMLDARARRGTDAVALNAIIDGEGLRSLQAAVEAVHVGAAVGRYMVALATATRESSEVEVGASPRGSLALLRWRVRGPRWRGATSSCPTTSRPSPSRRWPTGSCCARSCGSGASTPATSWGGCSTTCPPRPRPSRRTMSASASPTLASWVVLAAAGALAAVVLGEPALAALGAPFAVAAAAGIALARDPRMRVRASVAPERLLEGDRAVVTYDLRADGGAEWLELRVAAAARARGRAGRAGARPARGSRRPSPRRPARARRRAGAASWRAPRACAPPGRGRRVVHRDRAGRGRRPRPAGHRAPAHARGAGAHAGRGRPAPLAARAARGSSSPRCGRGFRATTRGGCTGARRRAAASPSSPSATPSARRTSCIFVDTFADLPSPPAREGALTLAVRAAAGLAEAHLRVRDRVGVVTFGGVLHWLAPGAGVRHALRIADALASSEVFMSYVAHDVTMVPPAILPSRALVLAITPLLDERGARGLLDLCARGHDVTVIEIDAPALLGAGRDPVTRLWTLRRAAMRARLAELGATTAVWDGSRPLESVLEEVTAYRRASRLAAHG